MSNSKIARLPYRRARQTDLLTFAENVYKRMKDAAAYTTLQAAVDTLPVPLQRYGAALAAARNRGINEVLEKNLAREELTKVLDNIVNELDILAAGREQLVVAAGFSMQADSGQRYNGILPAPEIVRAFSTGRKGELRINLKNFFPKMVRTHAFEYSLDQCVTWKNGEYNSNRSFVVNNLPHAAEMWIHVKSLGNGATKSDWSAPVVVAVL